MIKKKYKNSENITLLNFEFCYLQLVKFSGLNVSTKKKAQLKFNRPGLSNSAQLATSSLISQPKWDFQILLNYSVVYFT